MACSLVGKQAGGVEELVISLGGRGREGEREGERVSGGLRVKERSSLGEEIFLPASLASIELGGAVCDQSVNWYRHVEQKSCKARDLVRRRSSGSYYAPR